MEPHDPPHLAIDPGRFPGEGLGNGEGAGADDLRDTPLVAHDVAGPAVIPEAIEVCLEGSGTPLSFAPGLKHRLLKSRDLLRVGSEGPVNVQALVPIDVDREQVGEGEASAF